MVFNVTVMGRNCDDRTKNFSFLLRKGNESLTTEKIWSKISP